MAVRFGVSLPGPFFMSWGRTPEERRYRRRHGATVSVGYLLLQMILWMTLGVIWLTWVTFVLMYWGVAYLVNAIKDSRKVAGRHDARMAAGPEPVAPAAAPASPNEWSDRR